jgi:ribonuclease P protein component
LAKFNIINENKRFKILYKSGNSVVAKQLILYYKKNNLGINRFGITVSKKIGCSVKRNRAKRLIRESYRLVEKKVTVGYDFIFVCRVSINDCMRQNVDRTMWYVLNKANLIKNIKKSAIAE